MKFMPDQRAIPRAVALGMALGLAACASTYPPRDTSTPNAISAQLKEAAAPREKAPAPPVPESVSSSLLPPLRMTVPRASAKQLEQRFDLVVADAPINEVLMGIVNGTRYSIMVKPKNSIPSAPGVAAAQTAATAALPAASLTDRVTVNLKNVTMFEALDSFREVYGYDYTLDGNRIYVQQPELQTRLYQVDYVIGQRRGVSDMQVIGGASVGGSSGGQQGQQSGSGGSFSSVQASALSTIVKSDLWGEIEDALRTTLGCQIPRNLAAGGAAGGAGGGAAGGAGGGAAGGAGGGAAGGASRADVKFEGDMRSGERQRGVDGCTDGRAMSVSQMSGTVMIRGMPNEHRMVANLLRAMQLNVERQVIIEAKIIDVELNSGSQQGINWANFSNGLHRASVGANTASISETGAGGGTLATTLGGALGTTMLGTAGGTAFTAGLGLALQFRNFSAMINFLQTQGEVHVLSSPRIATLNSQKAVIKVGSEEPFVTNITGGTVTSVAGGAPVTTPATLQYQPFFSGISLDVTPKIDDKGNITLHVHAMVNSITEKEKISLPDIAAARVPFAVNTISQTDSVVKAKDGQVVVIGGLMTQTMSDGRSKMPGVGDVPGLGAMFSKGGQKMVKRELVILLRPTVVKDDSVWANDITAVQGRYEALEASRQAKPADQ